MPVYEYTCHTCRRRRTVFFKTISGVDVDPPCPVCGARGMEKLVSRVALARSDDGYADDMAEMPTFGDERDDAALMDERGFESGGDIDF